jgi:hypothetical protein
LPIYPGTRSFRVCEQAAFSSSTIGQGPEGLSAQSSCSVRPRPICNGTWLLGRVWRRPKELCKRELDAMVANAAQGTGGILCCTYVCWFMLAGHVQTDKAKLWSLVRAVLRQIW